MEIIALILFVGLMIINSGNKNRKRGNAAARKGLPADRRAGGQGTPGQPEKAARPAAGPVAEAANLDDVMAALNRQAKRDREKALRRPEPVVRAEAPTPAPEGGPMLADPECHGGSMEHTHAEGHSALEDEDCVGGSMEHTHTEGVSRSDHARRMAAIDSGHADDVLPETIDARALRRAVVMAEVLGKPRALRGMGRS